MTRRSPRSRTRTPSTRPSPRISSTTVCDLISTSWLSDRRFEYVSCPLRVSSASTSYDTHVVGHELERLQERRVPAADHGDALAFVQRAVAARAMAQALALELLLARQAEFPRSRPRRDDDGACVELAGVGHDRPVVSARLDASHLAQLERNARRRGLLVESRAELESRESIGEAGKVLDPLGVEDCAAGADGVEQHGGPAVTRSEESCGETGRPSARDGNVALRNHVRGPIIGC